MQEAPAKTQPGEIVEIESEEELDSILQERKDTLIVLLGSLTWCRPCKTLAKPLQVCSIFLSLCTRLDHPLDIVNAPSHVASPARPWPSRCRRAAFSCHCALKT